MLGHLAADQITQLVDPRVGDLIEGIGLLYPLSTFDATLLPDDGAQRVVFHCGSGKRSLTAAEKRRAAGQRMSYTWAAELPPGRPRVCRSLHRVQHETLSAHVQRQRPGSRRRFGFRGFPGRTGNLNRATPGIRRAR
jgi:rhodanese-related sulfurtransferase